MPSRREVCSPAARATATGAAESHWYWPPAWAYTSASPRTIAIVLAPAEPIGTSSASSAAWICVGDRGRAGPADDEPRRGRRWAAASVGGRARWRGRGPGPAARRRRSSATPSITERDVDGPVVAVALAELAGAVERVDDPDPRRRRAGPGRRPTPRRGSGRRVGPRASASRMRTFACASPARPQLGRVVGSWCGAPAAAGPRRRRRGPRAGDRRAVARAHRRCRASGSATIFSIFAGSLPAGEVREGHVLEHGAQAGARRDPHVDDARGRARVGEVLGRLAPDRAERAVDRADDVGDRDASAGCARR